MFQGLVDCAKYPNTNVAKFEEVEGGQSCSNNNANCDFVNNGTVICNNTGPNDNADDTTCNTLVDDDSFNLVDDTSFVNDDTLDDDSLIDMLFVDSCSFGGDWDDEDSIFCEETLSDLLPVEDDGTRSYDEVMFGVPQLALGQQEGDSGNAKVKGLLGVLFMFLLARVGYQAWVLAQLHASGWMFIISN